MRLQSVQARALPGGNAIELRWVVADPEGAKGIRIVRGLGRYPVSPTPPPVAEPPARDRLVADVGIEGSGANWTCTATATGERICVLTDRGLAAETVYYYSFFPYIDQPEKLKPGAIPCGQAAALATACYGMAERLYEWLPAIYRRYDAAVAGSGGAADPSPGPLRQFLEVIGGQFDQLYSLASASLDLHRLDRVDGRLLPLLAQWIGWQTDIRRDYDAQRNEIRNAPFLYRTIGTIPSIEATVRRVLDWESHTKEFVHNIFLTNAPPRLNLWSSEQQADGTWQSSPSLLSLDFCYEGRGTAVRDADRTVWLFYHAFRKGCWEIRYKTFTGQWQASQPLNPGRDSLDRHPSAAWYQGKLWVFWDTYLKPSSRWQINYRVWNDGSWGPIGAFTEKNQEGAERRAPMSAVDGSGSLWLFWLEQAGARWRLRYGSYPKEAGENPEPQGAMDFPLDGGEDPRVSDDGFVLFDGSKLWAFWSRKNAVGRWEIVHRVCRDPSTSQAWGLVCNLTPQSQSEYDDREPAACVHEGVIEVFWSSTRSGSWSIWHSALEDEAKNRWAPPAPLALGPYSQRAPLVVSAPQNNRRFVIFRSNQSVKYRSASYSATETLDARYGGSTTVEMRNAARLALRGQFEDFQRYIFDAGKASDPNYERWYFGECIGIYLTPGAEERPEIHRRNKKLAGQALRQFLPIQIKPVFIVEPPVYTESVYYYYDDPSGRHIDEALESRLQVRTQENYAEDYAGVRDSYSDSIPDWIWMRSWDQNYTNHRSVAVEPLKYREFRTWHVGVTQTGDE